MISKHLKTGRPTNFDSFKILKDLERDINTRLSRDKCFAAISGESTGEEPGPIIVTNELSAKLSQFEGTVKRLESSVESVKTDGWEDQFLKYNAQGFKLCDQLDKLGDLKDNNIGAYHKRKELVRRVTQSLEVLKKKSIENLACFLEFVKKKDQDSDQNSDLYVECKYFIEFKAESESDIKEIDDYRHKLMIIYTKK